MITWKEVLATVPPAPFNPSAKDEQALEDAFEDFVGGPDRGFRLMRLYTNVNQSLQGHKENRTAGWGYGPVKTVEQAFVEAAKRDGFTEEQAKAYLSVR